jgi:hypothetical protein
MTNLAKILRDIGKPAETLRGEDGSTILVLPYGGRILGLYPPDEGANFLWTNPALNESSSARAFYASPEWHNSGGDRTWIAPEIDFFFPNFPDLSAYVQPRALDPGRYALARSGDGIQLTNRLTLRASRTGEDAELQIARTVTPTENPLGSDEIPGLQFAGFMLEAELELLGACPAQGLGLWALLQLPHGGTMLIPTRSRSKPRIFFGEVPEGRLVVEDRCVRYRMNFVGDNKIALRASDCTGRAGYVYGGRSIWSLVVRDFNVEASGTYVDAPFSDPSDVGYAVQACNVSNAKLGTFSELEHHAPAIGGSTKKSRCRDASRVWAFRGEPEAVASAAEVLLGAGAAGDIRH